MASGLTRWIGAATLLCGGLAAALLPPTGEWMLHFVLGQPGELSPEQVRERELSSELTDYQQLLTRRVWVREFEEALMETAGPGVPIVPLGPVAARDPELRATWRNIAL